MRGNKWMDESIKIPAIIPNGILDTCCKCRMAGSFERKLRISGSSDRINVLPIRIYHKAAYSCILFLWSLVSPIMLSAGKYTVQLLRLKLVKVYG